MGGNLRIFDLKKEYSQPFKTIYRPKAKLIYDVSDGLLVFC